MSRFFSFLVVLSLFFLFVAAVHASPRKRFDEGTQTCRIFNQQNLWAGYKSFKDNCKNCHFQGNDLDAPFLHEESKTSKAWNRVFFKRSPLCASNGSWDGLDQNDLLKLNDYLYRSAFGTYNPNDAADCG